MINNQYTREALSKFAREVVRQSRANLTRGKKNKGKLYKSLGFDLKVHKNSYYLGLKMEDYGKFQDEGVRGAGGVRKTTSKYNRKNNKGKLWKIHAKNSRFSFKKENRPSVKHFKQWANSKGLNPYAIREAVFRQGIKPSLFFTKPFEKHFKNLPQEIIQAYGLDLDNVITER